MTQRPHLQCDQIKQPVQTYTHHKVLLQEQNLPNQNRRCEINDQTHKNRRPSRIFRHNYTPLIQMTCPMIYAKSHMSKCSTKRLQEHLSLLIPWFRSWRITANAQKTNAIMFSNKSKIDTPKIDMLDQKVKWSHSLKYLGVQIDWRLNFSQHIKKTVKKVKTAKAMLFPAINKNSSLNKHEVNNWYTKCR